MSFDWDSIKVINNPDLKEIEALFTPNSALSGTVSDPTEGVGGPADQPDGGGGGGTDDGGENGGGVIDCQPPEGYEECLGHDCYAVTDFVSELPDSDNQVKSLLAYENTSTDGLFPGFSYLDARESAAGELGTILLNGVISDPGTEEGPCAPFELWGTALFTQTSFNKQFIPNSIIPDMGAFIDNGEIKTQSGSVAFYLYGKDAQGTPKSFNQYQLITVGMNLWRDDTLTDFTEDVTCTANIYNDADKAYLEVNGGTPIVINADSKDITGFYSLNWDTSASLSIDGDPFVTANLTVTALGTTASAERSGVSAGFGWKADAKARLPRWQDKNYTRYFTYGTTLAASPKMIYVGDPTQMDIDAFEKAANRSIQGYTAPEDCVPWVRPAECPDCSVPSDCFPECEAYKSQLVNGATMGTEAELEAIYGTGPLDFDGIRFISKSGYNPAQGDDPAILPTYDTVEFASLAESGPGTDGPCVSDMYGLRPQEGNSIARLTIFSAAQMAAHQYQGDYTDTTADPPRKLVNDTVAGGYSALLHCPADTGSTKIIELGVPIKVYNGNLQAGTLWNLAWDRTAKQITITQGDGTNQVVAYDGGPLIDLSVQASVNVVCEEIPDSGGYLKRTDDFAAGFVVNGTSVSVASITESGLLVYGQWLGHYSNINSGTILGADVRVLAISKEGGPRYDAIKEAVKRSFATYVSTEPRCTGVSSEEGCPEEICPDDPCPCSCRGNSLDPLGCNPSIITGGLYDLADTRPITDGVFLNYDGSQGRVKEFLAGEVSNLLPDVNGKAKALFGNDVLYGFRDKNSGQHRGWATGDINYEGVPYTGGITQGFEFCALVGHTGNQVLNEPPLIQVPNMNGETFGRNGSIGYTCGIYLLKADNTPLISSLGFNIDVERSAPDTIRYREKNNFGGSDTIEVTLPPEVLDPNDNLFWVSVDIGFKFSNEGPAKDIIPDFQLASALAYRHMALANIYINGFQIASGVQANYKSGYFPDDKGMWDTVNTGAIPPVEFQNMKYGNFYTSNGTKVMATIPHINIQKPNLGTNEMFVAFMDEGPGASLIPTSEQGFNLKRIDPNNTPYADCNCS
jgi:hypothetical protein